jgi:hypothetical protein
LISPASEDDLFLKLGIGHLVQGNGLQPGGFGLHGRYQ